MSTYFKMTDPPTRPLYLKCDSCNQELNIVVIGELEKYLKQGWSREVSDYGNLDKRPAPLHYCPICSTERKNKLEGAKNEC